jgi:hypothetical protein
MRRTLRPLAAYAMLALIGAGCSNAPASTDSSGSSGSNDTTTTTTIHAQAVKFAECMRTHGVSGFPDPDASGSLTLDGVVNGSSLDPNSATFTHAISACKDLEPSGFTGRARSPEQQSAALRFARCIRDNGVSDFPDPSVDDPLVDTNRIPSTATQAGMSILNAAMGKCRAEGAAAGATGAR